MDILHPGQVLKDQPLYTLAKQIKWSWPGSHGEDQFVVMFGGLHIETAALKTLGDLMESSVQVLSYRPDLPHMGQQISF